MPEKPLPDGLPCFEPPNAPNSAGSVSFGPEEAEARRQLIALRQLHVELRVERIGGLHARVVDLVVRLPGRRGDVRRRQVRENRLRDRADAIGRDDVVRKRRAAGAVGVARQRIVDLRRRRAEVAEAIRRRRNDGARRPAGVVADVLVVAEEEQLVVLDRPAEREPALQVVAGRRGVREVAGRVRLLVVAEREDAALQRVRAGLERHVGDGAAGAAELRVVRARADVHRLDRLGRRNQRRQQPGAVVVVDPFDLDVVRQPRLAVDVGRQAVLGVEEIRVRALHPQRAGHHDQHPLEVAVEAERHFREVHALDDAARVGPVGLQQRALADDGDRLLDGADFELQIDAERRVHRHDDAVTHRFLEAAQFPGDAVGAVLQVREHVVARFVGDRRVRDVGVHLGDGHRDARQRKP